MCVRCAIPMYRGLDLWRRCMDKVQLWANRDLHMFAQDLHMQDWSILNRSERDMRFEF